MSAERTPSRRSATRSAIARLLLVPLGVALVSAFDQVVDAVDFGLYDAAQRARAGRQPVEPGRYVLVEIDDRSIAALGRFPWPRSVFASLVDRLAAGRPGVIGMDVLFTEAGDSAGDAELAAAVRRAGNVVLASATRFEADGGTSAGALGRLRSASGVIEPVPDLGAAAAQVGSISTLEDRDGSTRRYHLWMRIGDRPYPALAQSMAGVLEGGPTSVTVQGDGSMLINWGALSPESIERISTVDVLAAESTDLRSLVGGRPVMVGATFTGAGDIGLTPLGAQVPKAYVHLYALHTLLSGAGLRELPRGLVFLVAVLAVGLLSTQVPGRHPIQLLAMGAGVALLLLAAAYVFLERAGVVLWPGLPLTATVVFVSGYGLEQWWVTNRRLRRSNSELLETLENLRQTRSAKERLEAELDVARTIQLSMIPMEAKPFPTRRDFELRSLLVPARQVGGDFYDYFLLDEDHLYVCMADVSGKGVPAALFMAVSKALLKSSAHREGSPSGIMTRTNQELATDNDSAMFVTVWLGILDLRSGELRFANAGHNPPYVWTADARLIRVEHRHGPVLAAMEELEYGEDSLTLAAGDTLLLYTDGVPEAMNADGELFEESRMQDALTERRPSTADEVLSATADALWRFQAEAPQADDVTILALRFLGGPRGG